MSTGPSDCTVLASAIQSSENLSVCEFCLLKQRRVYVTYLCSALCSGVLAGALLVCWRREIAHFAVCACQLAPA